MSAPNPSDHTEAIKAALLAGDKIGAIKLYREQTGVGLAEAKVAIEAMQAGDTGPMTVPPPKDNSAAIREALFAGQKIWAIKLYREQNHCGLAEAKAAVEKIEADLRQTAPGLFTAKAAGKGCLACLSFGAVAGAALWKIFG